MTDTRYIVWTSHHALLHPHPHTPSLTRIPTTSQVNKTLQAMLEAKVAHYNELGDVLLARVLRCFSPIFLPIVSGADMSLDDGPLGDWAGGGHGSAGIDHVKAVFHWRDDATEAAWQKETGWSLLTLACTLDDEAAVTALLATDEGRAMIHTRGKLPKPKGSTLRVQPFSKMFLDMSTGMSPLMAAVTFSRPSVITALLDSGAPMPVGTKLFGDNPCQFRGLFAGKLENLKLLLHRFPDLATKVNQTGTTACAFACMLSKDQGQFDILKELLDYGAASTLSVQHCMHGTPLMSTTPKLVEPRPDALHVYYC